MLPSNRAKTLHDAKLHHLQDDLLNRKRSAVRSIREARIIESRIKEFEVIEESRADFFRRGVQGTKSVDSLSNDWTIVENKNRDKCEHESYSKLINSNIT